MSRSIGSLRVGRSLTGEALRMASLHPAQLAGCADQRRCLEKGFRACVALLDENLIVKGIIANGYLRLAE